MTKRLLILDDEADFVELIGGIAQRLGWTTETTPSRAGFRAAVARPLDAIALGLGFDGSDGIELLRFLGQVAYRNPILLMGGIDDRVLLGAQYFGVSLGLSVAGALKKPARAAAVYDALQKLELPSGRRNDAWAAGGPLIGPAAIAQAIAGGQMTLFLQPIMAADGLDVHRFEALIRWRHPERGLLMPDSFIPIAEQELGVIDQLTHWVFEAAIDTHLALRAHDLPSTIAVNVSPSNLQAVDLPDRVEALLHSKGVGPHALHVEVAARALTAAGSSETLAALARFRLKGFALALDDFRGDAKALDALETLSFSELKIDKPLIDELLTSGDAHAIVRSVVRRARSLSLRTVAEGVETAEATAELRALGVTSLQGFYFSPPQPLTSIRETVATLRWGRRVMDRATRLWRARRFNS